MFDSVIPGARTGLEVRDYHRNVKGVMEDGSRYHALDPDVFYWAHATFWYGNVRLCERFGPFLTEDQKRQLFEESKAWYAQYGVSMRPVPETYEDFLEYWITCAATSFATMCRCGRFSTSPSCRRPRSFASSRRRSGTDTWCRRTRSCSCG